MRRIFSLANQRIWVAPMKLDLDGMSADELWSLHEEIGKILSDRITTEKRELERRLAQLKRDYPIDDSLPEDNISRAPRQKYPEVIPKYRNPETPHETWAGRGKQPRWMVAALKSGSKIEDFLIRNQTSDKRSGRSQHKSK
jgi:DNA-binding protein H-NS